MAEPAAGAEGAGAEALRLDLAHVLEPPAQAWANAWTQCSEAFEGAPCRGRATQNGKCLGHMSLVDARAELVKQIKQREVNLQGVPVGTELFEVLTNLVDHDRETAIKPLDFAFAAATFPSQADFFGWEFTGTASFQAVRFNEGARFGGAIFRYPAWFHGTSFLADADFENTLFDQECSFAGARFGADANFHEARFKGPVTAEAALVVGDLTFTAAGFFGNQWLGPFASLGLADFTRTNFEGDLTLEASGAILNFDSTRFAGTVTMRLRWSAISLETVGLSRPALIASSHPFEELEEDRLEEFSESWPRRESESFPVSPLPRIESLRYANVEALTLANTDLRACRLAGVRNLDRLRLEGDAHFESTPRLRSRRRTIAEEQRWRSSADESQHRAQDLDSTRRPRHWNPPSCDPLSPFVKEEPTQPRQLASIYRALRKSLEDGKDAPGAADFYFGEMEMRRLSRTTPRAERALIAAYWLLSGYGLRASRSLACLVGVIVLFGWGFDLYGFETEQSLAEGMLTSMRSVALLPYGDSPTLTQAGEAMQIALRILGPLLAGLTLLAIRARIKR